MKSKRLFVSYLYVAPTFRSHRKENKFNIVSFNFSNVLQKTPKNVSKIKNTKFQIRIPIILSIGLAAGILLGANIMNTESRDDSLITSLMKFREILTAVDKAYVDEVNTEDLVEMAITKMLEELDPHTVYIPAEEAKLSNDELKGEFDGIGIEFNVIKDTIYVVAPLSGGPSEKVGILAGDKIVKIDDETVAGVNISNRGVIDRLRGTRGTEVTVGIKRKGEAELIYFTIVRDKIPQFSVDVSYMIDNKTGYIKVSRFSATTYTEFVEAVQKLNDQGMKQLVLDLQSNPGGYMDRAVNMADELLGGDVVIVSQKGKEGRFNAEFRARKQGLFEEGPVIVLIDEGSASGSEIVAGALQDNDRALIVGRRSFGKGLVQQPIPLSDGSELRLTISRYYTPSGRSIQKPYNGDLKDYMEDQQNRFMHGEFFHADSIKFNDSLKYETRRGRVVYGGGGIMPDFFVPLDTSNNSSYLNKLFFSNAMREFTLKLQEKHEKRLKKMSFEQFKNEFEVTDEMLADLVKIGESVDVPYDEKGFTRSKSVIKLRTKAQLARSVWGNEGFYPIINENNEILNFARGLFDEAEKLAETY